MEKKNKNQVFIPKCYDPFLDFQIHNGEIPNIFEFEKLDKAVREEFAKMQLIKEFSNYEFRPSNFGNLDFAGMFPSGGAEKCELRSAEVGIWILMGFEENKTIIYYKDSARKRAWEITRELEKFKPQEESVDKHIHLLYKGSFGFYLKKHKIDESFTSDIPLNYGDDFVPIYEKLSQSIAEEKTGLFLLSSKPGMGKTSLIKSLVGSLENQKILFLPPYLASAFSDPSFLPFVADENIDLVVIEDAEGALRNRDDGGGDSVSSILNLTDGIMGDILKVKVLATFNTDIENIDKALLRKGRLKFQHEFKPLKAVYADRLLEKLGKPPQGKDLTLADIYNFDKDNGRVEKKVLMMGFNAKNN